MYMLVLLLMNIKSVSEFLQVYQSIKSYFLYNERFQLHQANDIRESETFELYKNFLQKFPRETLDREIDFKFVIEVSNEGL